MKSSNFGYLGSIDQLRGIAALWIASYHYYVFASHYFILNRPYSSSTPVSEYWLWSFNPLHSILASGHSAVSMFMVLSGFIFTYGAGSQQIQYLGFIKNRLLRVYPLWVILALCGVATTTSAVDLLTFVEALLPIGLRSNPLPWTPFTAMHWSLVIEFQFYLLFPLLLAAAQKLGFSRFIVVLIGGLILLRVFAIGFGADSLKLAYYGILGRLDQFLLGMLLAYFYSIGFPSKTLAKFCLPVVLAVTILLMMYAVKNGLATSQGWGQSFRMTLEGAIWALVIGCYLQIAEHIPRWASVVLEKVGEMSFSIYMLHITVLWLFVIHNPWIRFGAGVGVDLLTNFFVLVLPSILLTAFVSFQAFEKPFLSLRVRYLKP